MSIKIYDFTCRECGITKSYQLDEADVKRWREDKELIQRVFPHIKDREIMISGFCSDCFDKLFADEDEDGSVLPN